MIKRTIGMVFVTLVVLSAAFAGHTVLQQRQLSQKLIRLHVVANSDTQEDQEIKLRVRDAVLSQVSELTADCTGVEQAKQRLQENLPALEQLAGQVLENTGKPDNVTVSLQQEVFPTRYYDTFTLPAGKYLSLRVSIGQGTGHNWWCVVFPSLCAAATMEDWEEAAMAGQFTDEEEDLISGGEEKYVLKFKALEWLQKLFE